VIAALAGLAAACLPNRLATAELAARVAAAKADGGADASADASADAAVGPGCGNGVVEADEACDDKSGSVCGGCEACHLRRALDVSSKAVVAAVPNEKVKSIDAILSDAKTGLSMEVWFNAAKLPAVNGADGFAGMAAVGGVAAKVAPAWVMGVKREGDKNAMYPTCALTFGPEGAKVFVVAQGADPVMPGSWHHLRCAVSGKTGKVLLSLDGGPVRSSTNDVGKAPIKFDPATVIGVGAIAADPAKPDQHFVGLIDELRVVVGAAADDFGDFRWRYVGNEPGTQLLYHMDLGPDDQMLHDASVNGLHAQQLSGGTFGKSALPSVPDGCRGQPEAAAKCQAAAPWCPK